MPEDEPQPLSRRRSEQAPQSSNIRPEFTHSAAWPTTDRPSSGRGGGAPKEGKASLDPRQARKVIDGDRGKLPLHELLRCRLRYLTDGYVGDPGSSSREAATPLEGLRKKPVRPP